MARPVSLVLGIGLLVLWIVGLSSPAAPGWLTWLDGIAGIIAFVVAGMSPPASVRAVGQAGGPAALSAALFVLWIVGLASAAVTWQVWWNFGFACAFAALALAEGSRRRGVVSPDELEQERLRR